MATSTETVDHDCIEKVDELSLEEKVDKTVTNEFAEKTSKTDMAFVVEGERLYVSSLVIGMFSPVFDKMISDRVKNEHGLLEIEIKEYSLRDFKDFLLGFYPGKHGKISDSSVFWILPLAHKFEVQSLIELCEYRLMLVLHYSTVPPDVLSQCMTYAYDFNIEKAKKKSLDIFRKKQKYDYTQRCMPLPANHEAKSDILEALLPRFILTENKLAFSLAFCPKDTGLFLSGLADHCQYKKLDLYIHTDSMIPVKSSVIGNSSIEFPCMKIKFTNERSYSDMKFRLEKVGKTKIAVDTSMAVLYRIHNISQRQEDIYLAKQLAGSDNISNKSLVLLNGEMIKRIEKNYSVDGKFHMTVHVLLYMPDRQGSNKNE